MMPDTLSAFKLLFSPETEETAQEKEEFLFALLQKIQVKILKEGNLLTEDRLRQNIKSVLRGTPFSFIKVEFSPYYVDSRKASKSLVFHSQSAQRFTVSIVRDIGRSNMSIVITDYDRDAYFT